MVNNATFRHNKSRVHRAVDYVFGKTAGDRTFHCINYVILLLIAFATAYPFLYVVIESLRGYELNAAGESVVRYSFNAYKAVFDNSGMLRAFFLTIGVTALHIVLNVAITMMSAYALTEKRIVGRTAILVFVLITMLFSGGLIPYYLLIRDLGLRDSPMVYVFVGMLSAYNIIIAKNFMNGIPSSLKESAKIDGANDFTVFVRIYLPLSGPIIATVALWVGVGKWNDWMTGVLYITNPNLKVIQNYLRTILITTSSGTGDVDVEIMSMADSVKMASIIVGMLPILIVYPFVQKYFVKGMLIGSVKG